jgi:hypothetical protein
MAVIIIYHNHSEKKDKLLLFTLHTHYRWLKDKTLMSAPWRPVPPHISFKLRQGAGRASTRCHASCSFRPHLPTEVGSGAATCPATLDLTSLLSWAPAPPHVPQLRTSPPCQGGLRRCHVSHGSGAATCSSAPDLASLPRWAPVLSRGPGLASSRGELRCCHVPHGPQRAVDHRNKEGPSCPGTQLGSHVSKAQSRVTETPARHADRSLQFGSTVQRNPSWPLLDMATVVIWPDRTAPQRWPCSV